MTDAMNSIRNSLISSLCAIPMTSSAVLSCMPFSGMKISRSTETHGAPNPAALWTGSNFTRHDPPSSFISTILNLSVISVRSLVGPDVLFGDSTVTRPSKGRPVGVQA